MKSDFPNLGSSENRLLRALPPFTPFAARFAEPVSDKSIPGKQCLHVSARSTSTFIT